MTFGILHDNMGPKSVLLLFVLGGSLIPGFYCKNSNFADIIKGLPDTFVLPGEESRELGWPAAPPTPRGLLPFYMIAEHFIDAYSGHGLQDKFDSLQKSCSLGSLAILILPALLGVIAAVVLIVLQVVNIILTVVALVTNLAALTGKRLALAKSANVTMVEEFEECNSQLARLIRHDCEFQARDLNMVQLGDKDYYFSHSSIKMRWDEAQTFCRTRCQQLVSIEDPIEETAIFDHLTVIAGEEGMSMEPFWTSGSYKNGKYKWLATGRDFGYINLAPPRQHKRSQARQGTVDASCVGMASVKNETAWIGAPCEQMNRFVCEKPLQLAYRDHFLYETVTMEEEAEAAAIAATAPTEASATVTPAIEDDRFNEIRRRLG